MQLLKSKITKPNALIKWREENGISRDKMADIFGVSVCHYTNIEKGNTRVPFKIAVIISQLSNIRLMKLIPDLYLSEKEKKQAMAFLKGKTVS